MEIALVVGEGVLGEECDAVRATLPEIADAEVVHVGSSVGEVCGPGGVQPVDATYRDVTRPDVIVVPGTLGCVRAATDPELRSWLQRVEPHARWVVASSTGPLVLAAAGVLDGHRAVAHWLAIPLLQRYPGVTVMRGPSVLRSGRFITCIGRVSAHDAAIVVVRDLGGDDAADRILERSTPRPQPAVKPTFIELVEASSRPDRRRSRHTP